MATEKKHRWMHFIPQVIIEQEKEKTNRNKVRERGNAA